MTHTERIQRLEQQAIEAHAVGTSWPVFRAEVEAEVKAIEPMPGDRQRRLVEKLLHLVVSGDPAGALPPCDWEGDYEAALQAQEPILQL